jgi:hypothetical protein
MNKPKPKPKPKSMNKPKPKSRGGTMSGNIPTGIESIIYTQDESIIYTQDELDRIRDALTYLKNQEKFDSFMVILNNRARNRMTLQANKQNRTSRSNNPNSRTSQIPELSQRP